MDERTDGGTKCSDPVFLTVTTVPESLIFQISSMILREREFSIYGMYPSDDVDQNAVSLRPALRLVSHVSFVKEVGKGTSISYGGTYITEKKMKIATIPVGYGDGYPRSLSNKGYVLIHGKRQGFLEESVWISLWLM